MIGLAMFLSCLVLLSLGFPVAFTFGGVALIFGLYAEGLQLFQLVAERMHSIMTNSTLMAVPLFIFMGLILERSGIAEKMLESMGSLFGRVRGGLAASTVLVGMVLAASTGVVGASVVTMGLIALPVMLKYNYDKRLASGVICASGTLGQIIPPSIILIILGMFCNNRWEIFTERRSSRGCYWSRFILSTSWHSHPSERMQHQPCPVTMPYSQSSTGLHSRRSFLHSHWY